MTSDNSGHGPVSLTVWWLCVFPSASGRAAACGGMRGTAGSDGGRGDAVHGPVSVTAWAWLVALYRW